jgi:hypothetical protein
MPARTAVRLVSPLHFSARLPSHALPVDGRPGTRLDEERVRVRIMHASKSLTELCLNHRHYQRGKCNLVSCHNDVQYQI